MKQQHPEHKPDFLPTEGIPGSSYQPISSQLYRYVGCDRSIDTPETKSWRKRMRGLKFQIFHIAHEVYASGLGESSDLASRCCVKAGAFGTINSANSNRTKALQPTGFCRFTRISLMVIPAISYFFPGNKLLA